MSYTNIINKVNADIDRFLQRSSGDKPMDIPMAKPPTTQQEMLRFLEGEEKINWARARLSGGPTAVTKSQALLGALRARKGDF